MSSIAADSHAVNEAQSPARPARRWQLRQLFRRFTWPRVHAFKLADNRPESVSRQRESAADEVQFAAPEAVQQVLDDNSVGRQGIPLYFIEFDVNGRRVFAGIPFDKEGAGGFAWAAELERREPEVYCYRLPEQLVKKAELVPHEVWSKWDDGGDTSPLDKLSTIQHAIHMQFTNELNKLDCVFSSLDHIGLFAKWVKVQYEAIAEEFGAPLLDEPETIIADLCSGNTVISDETAYKQLGLPVPNGAS